MLDLFVPQAVLLPSLDIVENTAVSCIDDRISEVGDLDKIRQNLEDRNQPYREHRLPNRLRRLATLLLHLWPKPCRPNARPLRP